MIHMKKVSDNDKTLPFILQQHQVNKSINNDKQEEKKRCDRLLD